MRLSSRMSGLAAGESAVMAERASALRAQGLNPVSLAMGEPSFGAPDHAIEAACEAARTSDSRYPPVSGTARLKAAVQRKFQVENGLAYELDEIIVANGSKQLMLEAFGATCTPGDEIIVPRPGWIAYEPFTRMVDAVPVAWACPESTGFIASAAELDRIITPKTRWVIINNPSNPTGAVCDRATLQAYAEVLLRHPHVDIISDDMYEHMVYAEEGFFTIAQLEPRLKSRVLTINGASKGYGMPGWRVGYAGGNRELVKAMNTLQGYWTGGVATVCQAAAVAALEGDQGLIAQRKAVYRANRDFVLDALRRIPQITCHTPEGAFYLFPNISGCIGLTTAGGRRIDRDTDFVQALFDEELVAAVAGSAYGLSPYLRLSYATTMANLEEAMTRLTRFCAGLRR